MALDTRKSELDMAIEASREQLQVACCLLIMSNPQRPDITDTLII